MYVSPNFKTKKALREAVTNNKKVTVFSPGPFKPIKDGIEFVEGPHSPEPHKWYAKIEIKNGFVVKVF